MAGLDPVPPSDDNDSNVEPSSDDLREDVDGEGTADEQAIDAGESQAGLPGRRRSLSGVSFSPCLARTSTLTSHAP